MNVYVVLMTVAHETTWVEKVFRKSADAIRYAENVLLRWEDYSVSVVRWEVGVEGTGEEIYHREAAVYQETHPDGRE